MDDDLLPIGRFARLAGLSVGALRHYDELDLLRPAEVDEITGYRRYRREPARRRPDDRPPARAGGPARGDPRRARGRRSGGTRPAGSPTIAPGSRRGPIDSNASSTRWGGVVDRKEPIVTRPPGPPDLDQATRRALAVGLFNHTWTLLEMHPRTAAQDDEMLHSAHASRYHWGEVSDDVHLARGEWQCARVYAVLGRAEPALWHARRCVELVEADANRAMTGTWRRPTRRWPGRTSRRATRRGRGLEGPCRGGPDRDRRPRGPRADRTGPRHASVMRRDTAIGLGARRRSPRLASGW